MKLRRRNKRDKPPSSSLPQSPLAEFPFELLDRIIVYFIRVPCVSFERLKSLRLVCKNFNDAVRPRVMSCVRLFGMDDNPMSNMRQLQTILSSDLQDRLCLTTTLFMGGWKWRYSTNLFVSFRSMRKHGVPKVWGVIWNSTFVPLEYLFLILCAPHLASLAVHDSVARLCTRYRLSHPSVLNMPNLRRVIWKAEAKHPNWITSGTVKLLLGFRQLSELVLLVNYDQDLSYIFNCFSKLHGLRKLRIEVLQWWQFEYQNRPDSDSVEDLGKVIAANLSLTHLELFLSGYVQVRYSRIFGQVPADRPLKLEHLSICDKILDVQAIIPHVRSLTSMNYHMGYNPGQRVLQALLSESIFPPFIQLPYVDDHVLNYLKNHPRIVKFSATGKLSTLLLEIVARHSASLTHLGILWVDFLTLAQNEFLLTQCTNLRQLELYKACTFYLYPSEMEASVLSVIARLPSSLILVVTELPMLQSFIKHCSQSQDPLIHDLTGRIVYETKLSWVGDAGREWLRL